MEYQFSLFSLSFSFLFFIFMVLRIWKKPKVNGSFPNLPPGPWKLPIIGNMHQMVGSLTHRRLKELAQIYGPVMHLQLGEVSNVVISTPEAAKDALKTHESHFLERPFLLAADIVSYNSTNLVFAPHGEYWKQLRRICIMELLSIQRVQSFRSIREEVVSDLLKSISSSAESHAPVNLTRMIFDSTFGITAKAAFGKICKGQEEFVPTVEEIMREAGGFSISDVFPSVELLHVITGMKPKFERLHKKADRILQNIIAEHKARKLAPRRDTEGEAVDLVDVLLNVQDRENLESPLTDDNIKAVILDVFVAGSETSSTTVEWAMSEMLREPRVLKKAQSEVREFFGKNGAVNESQLHELNYLKLVIKETLRLHPPAPLLVPRECAKTCEVYGYTIPVKTRLIVNAWALGRDPRHWMDAETFFPERFVDRSIDYKGANFELIPFGSGRRMCPGMAFGIANVELLLSNFLYHFDWKSPDGSKLEDIDMGEVFGATTRKKKELYLIPIPSNPVHRE